LQGYHEHEKFLKLSHSRNSWAKFMGKIHGRNS
jgi:hypothetical protein